MGIFDIFRKKKTAENLSVKTQDSSLTSEEKQNIEILTKNVVDEFSKNNVRGKAADELGKSSNLTSIILGIYSLLNFSVLPKFILPLEEKYFVNFNFRERTCNFVHIAFYFF